MNLNGRFRQLLEGIHPIQTGNALGDRFGFGLEDMPEPLVVLVDERPSVDDPRTETRQRRSGHQSD